MPLPPVNDRIKEIPAQTLRAVFAGIGQILLIADKLRARAVEQVSGPDAAPAAQPANPAQRADATQRADAARTAGAAGPGDATGPADAAQPVPEAPRRPPRATGKPAPGRAQRGAPPAAPQRPRWRSLDETGNVRLLDEGEEDLAPGTKAAAEPAAKAAAEPAASPATSSSSASAAAAPTAAAPTAAAPTAAAPTAAAPTATAPTATAPTATAQRVTAPAAPATRAPATPDTPAAGAGALPLANYDQLSLASLRARLRVLDAAQVSLLLDYEKAHESRPDVVTMFERRIAKLNAGN
jgi:hypothetical protein